MFWGGFIFSYILLFSFLFFGKYIEQHFSKGINEDQEVFCAFVFIMFSYILTLLYTCITFITGNMLASAFICVSCLLISWTLTETVYRVIAGTCEVLTIKDKNVCHLFSITGVVLSSLILGWENAEMGYGIIISCAISIIIGAYVPIKDIYDDKKISEMWDGFIEHFRGSKMTVKLAGAFCLLLTVILVSSNGFTVKLQTFIDTFGTGLAVGIFSMVVVLIGISIVKEVVKKES